MNDIRALLARSKTVPQVNRRTTNFLTIHWNGPAFTASDLEQIKGDARYHVNVRGWDGLSYAVVVGRDGQLYQTRDLIARLNHAGVPFANSESLSVLVLTGEGMTPPGIQLASLERLLSVFPARWVFTHQESPRLTACPGPLLTRWVNARRTRYEEAVTATTIVTANVRDEANVLSHVVRQLPINTAVSGVLTLGKPVKGDAAWLRIGNDYVHASTLKLHNTPVWALPVSSGVLNQVQSL